MTPTSVTDAPLLGEPWPVEFMNTIWADRAGLHDSLATDAGIEAWVRAAFPTPDMTTADLQPSAQRLRELRNAMRRLAAAQTGDPRAVATSGLTNLDQAVSTVNSAAAGAPHWHELRWPDAGHPSRAVSTHAGAGAVRAARLAEQAIELFTSDQRLELRACLAPGCVLYFLKHHPRREWCSTTCGNRARAARHYQRHRTAGSG